MAGMVVGLIIRLSPGHLIREMLVGIILDVLGEPSAAEVRHERQTLRRYSHSSTPCSSTCCCRQLSSTRATSSSRCVLPSGGRLVKAYRPGKLLPQLWRHPHLCFPGHFHLRCRYRVSRSASAQRGANHTGFSSTSGHSSVWKASSSPSSNASYSARLSPPPTPSPSSPFSTRPRSTRSCTRSSSVRVS